MSKNGRAKDRVECEVEIKQESAVDGCAKIAKDGQQLITVEEHTETGQSVVQWQRSIQRILHHFAVWIQQLQDTLAFTWRNVDKGQNCHTNHEHEE